MSLQDALSNNVLRQRDQRRLSQFSLPMFQILLTACCCLFSQSLATHVDLGIFVSLVPPLPPRRISLSSTGCNFGVQ
jgi:hypothetical protein